MSYTAIGSERRGVPPRPSADGDSNAGDHAPGGTLGWSARLSDGTEVYLRPVTPSDKGRLAEGLEGLSAGSRYFRFFTNKRRFSGDELRYLTEVDGLDHVALGVLDTEGRGLGVGRFIRMDGGVAEVAITVVDAMQGRRVGQLLLWALLHAARGRQVTTFRFAILSGNVAMRRLVKSFGGEYRGREGDVELFELDTAIARPHASQPDAAAQAP